MKFKLLYILPVALVAMLTSCKKDNYDEPSSKLSGRVVYQGQPLGFETSQDAVLPAAIQVHPVIPDHLRPWVVRQRL